MSCRRPVGLVAWFSLWVREVPGSTPGQARLFLFYSYSYFLLYVVGHPEVFQKVDSEYCIYMLFASTNTN